MTIRVLIFSLLALLGSSPAVAAVHALFDPESLERSPYPSDRFTRPDRNQQTGRTIALPMPDCYAQPSLCQDVEILNRLDGFNVQPRFSIPFDGPIDPLSVTSRSVFLVPLDSRREREGLAGPNRIVWDPVTFTLHFHSDQVLDQHSRYALIVTNSVRAANGRRVEASSRFEAIRNGGGGSHGQDIRRALRRWRSIGLSENEVVVADVFTTQTVTGALEQIRDQLWQQTPVPTPDFQLNADGTKSVFPLSQLLKYEFLQQTTVQPPDLTPLPNSINGICDNCGANLLTLFALTPDAVGTLAFGKYRSPDYEVHPGEYIPDLPTASDELQPTGTNEVYFNLFLPASAKPTGGWPVAIFGHGSGTNKNVQPFAVAGVLAQHGIATICINIAGNGLGSRGELRLTKLTGSIVTLSAGGRGIDQNGDNRITEGEGRGAAPPLAILGSRDGQRQTVIDLMQLVRLIDAGIDVDGDRIPDLDRTRIYYFGHSLGGHYGAMLLALEPLVRAGVLIAPGTPTSELRLTPMFRSSSIGGLLASRTPSLINSPGLTEIGGVPVGPPYFNENLPFEDQLPMTNGVEVAMPIQSFLDTLAWVAQSSTAASWAPHFRESPLIGRKAKPVLLQLGTGDQLSPNPMTSSIVRAGHLEGSTTVFRNDIAFLENPAIPKNPHFSLTGLAFPPVADVSRGMLEQIAQFFVSDGALIIHPQPQHLFDVPILLPLPEQLSFIP